MQLFLAGLDGRTHTIDVDGTATGMELKKLIAARMGVDPSLIRLSLGSAELDDNDTLDAQGVADRSSVQANGRLRGGNNGNTAGVAIGLAIISGIAGGIAGELCTIV